MRKEQRADDDHMMTAVMFYDDHNSRQNIPDSTQQTDPNTQYKKTTPIKPKE